MSPPVRPPRDWDARHRAAIVTIAQRDGVSREELSTVLQVSPSTACRLVERLRAAQLVEERVEPGRRHVSGRPRRLVHLAARRSSARTVQPAARPGPAATGSATERDGTATVVGGRQPVR